MAQVRDERGALERFRAERCRVVIVERRLEGRGADVAVENARVRVVEDRGFDAALEQRLRLAHEELVKGVLRGDEHGEAVVSPTRSSPLLAQARHGSGKPDADDAVEQADVDTELERIRGAHAEQVAADEPLLDLPALCGRVAGPVRGEPRRIPEALRGEAVDELRRLAALGEAERPDPALDERRHQPRGLAEWARAQAELLIGERWVPERDRALGLGSAVVVDHGRLDAEQSLGQLAGVGDRRGGEQELRIGPVDAGEPPEPAKDVSNVGAEDAAVDVRLVDDDIAEVGEDITPAVVVRQDADMEHVRVGEDQVRPLANLPPLGPGCVAVIDRGLDPWRAELGQRTNLVLGQRLRRVEVERPQLGLAGKGVEDGKVERERLAGRGAGGDDQVLAAGRRVPGRGLMGEELRDAGCGEHVADTRLEVVRDRLEPRGAGGLGGDVGELLAGEQVVPEVGGDAQRRARIATRKG